MPLNLLRSLFWMMLKFLRLLRRHSEGLRLRHRRLRANLREKSAARVMVAEGTQTPPEMEPKRRSKEKEEDKRIPALPEQLETRLPDRSIASGSATGPAPATALTNRNLAQSLHQALPPELWSVVSEFLDETDLRAFRTSCHFFHDAAHQTWARTLDQRTFALTCTELRWLVEILERTKAGPHIKTLRIDAQVACRCREVRYWEWVGTNLRSLVEDGRKKFLGFPRGERDDSACAALLADLVALVPQLTLIELSAGQRTGSEKEAAGGWQSDPPARIDRYLSVPRWASWRAMDMLVSAFKDRPTPSSADSIPLPSPQRMVLRARMPMEALPGHLVAFCGTRLFSNLSKLSLSLTRAHLDWYSDGYDGVVAFLPEFLELLPRTLQELELDFPRDRNHLIQFGQGASVHFDPLFGDDGWGAVANKSTVTFPNLHALHLSHLRLSKASLLQAFLHKHTTSLRALHLTSLALTGEDWKPFLQFLAMRMRLDTLVMDSDISAEEREVERRIWMMTPAQHHPSAEDWRQAAKESWMNGRKIEERKEVAGQGQGMDGQGMSGEQQSSDEQPALMEESGYEGDGEAESVLAA